MKSSQFMVILSAAYVAPHVMPAIGIAIGIGFALFAAYLAHKGN